MLSKEQKGNIIKEFSKTDQDTGSCEVQIAIISKRIKDLSSHLKSFPKDKHSKLGLLKLVGKRKSFYKYLKNKDNNTYISLMKKLKDGGYI